MKVLMILLAGLLAMVLWLRHDNVNLSRSFEKASRVASEQAVKREETITRLMNENETLRRWYSDKLPDAVRRLHIRTGCASAARCLQRLPEGESLPDAGKRPRQ
ncbi:TPA: LysB family phage lysis regulatory protein [Escherichia coli]|nr:LysB family phage lysis regulatory protein [Escherichia coli]